jgi:hypothetical protein
MSCQLALGDDWKGVNVDFIDGIINYAQDTQGKSGTHQGYWGNVNPQHSLILSAATLCIPGVIYNLQKARAIDCNYIQCLQQTQDGMPLYMCTDQRAYAYCKFVWGEVFNAIPFTSAISQIGQNVLKALSHPFEFIGFLIKGTCTITCLAPFAPAGPGCAACTTVEYLNIALDTLCDLGINMVGDKCKPFWDGITNPVNQNVCSQVLGNETTEDTGDV